MLIKCHTSGPCPRFLLPFVQKGSKILENSRVSFKGSIKHHLTVCCLHNALGQWLVMPFAIRGDHFPNSWNIKRWLMTQMWPGNSASCNVTYQRQTDDVNLYLRTELNILVRKVTHVFRVLGARTLDEADVDLV